MTHDEMIAVIQAHKEGKTIQARMKADEDEEWVDLIYVSFDFRSTDYRIKPESRYRPFNNAEEVMEAMKEHGCIVKCCVHDKVQVTFNFQIIALIYNEHAIKYEFGDDAMCVFKFIDGTRFGVKEE